MRQSFRILFLLTTLFAIFVFHNGVGSYAALPVVGENDLISIGYRLTVQAELILEYTEEDPFKGQVAFDVIRPIGLYNEIKLGRTMR